MGVTRKELFSITGLRGSIGDPKVVTKSLLKYHEKGIRKNSDSSHICWQDIEIPIPFECSETQKVFEYIANTLSTETGRQIESSHPWTICNGPLEQTYPHSHVGNGCEWSCVYWAQVPENSGTLNFYPLGLEGPETSEEPTPGDFLVFPSNLLHGVRHNASSEKRVSMSFNMRYVS
jgi:hypothetical protein